MRQIAIRIPPPVYAGATGALIWGTASVFPALEVFSAPFTLLGWPIIVLGMSVDVAAFAMFWRHRTTINPLHPERATALVQLGPYRFSRNPMYLGLTLVLIGLSWLRGAPACWLFVAMFVWLISKTQISPEEWALERNFGEAYIRYTSKVSRWFGWRRQEQADRSAR